MLDTIYLIPETWDLAVDAYGNIAMANAPYAVAQDVASACRLWQGEAIYDTTRGLPYADEILGQLPPSNILINWYKIESMTVPNVANSSIILQYDNSTRVLGGQIQLTLTDGTTNVINL
jgi:hypothetical protein